jgi:hypothetical protein
MKVPALLAFIDFAGPLLISPTISCGLCPAQFLKAAQTFKTVSHIRFQSSFTRTHLHISSLSHGQFLYDFSSPASGRNLNICADFFIVALNSFRLTSFQKPNR